MGQNFCERKEINVILIEKPENGYRFAAITAAGKTGIKMGLNERGVAVASNISRTTELRQRRIDVEEIRAIDRNWLMREGIANSESASEGTQLIVGKLVEKPMVTPGNIEFVDNSHAFVIEGSYDRYAVTRIPSGILARTNRFVLLNELNDPEDVSSYVRYVRAMQLLGESKGRITVEKMIGFSQDHTNGPGPNSICRHSADYRSETTLAASVMEIHPSDPSKSVFYACLGKPCHAWRNSESHLAILIGGLDWLG